jgi:hypothetical protein
VRENIFRRARYAALASASELGNAAFGGDACLRRGEKWTHDAEADPSIKLVEAAANMSIVFMDALLD